MDCRSPKSIHTMKMITRALHHRIGLCLVISAISFVGLAASICPEPNEIKPCTCDDEGLQCLKLNDSGLERVFQAPAERKVIRRVWIFRTNLTTLHSRAFGDYIIRDLYLDLNKIQSIEEGAFGEASKTLQSLSLTRNLLREFPPKELSSMKRLRQLGLGHNQLTKLTSNSFPPSETLESIDLTHNSIRMIEANTFAELYEISLIDLSRNSLSEINSNALLVKSTSRNVMISLRGNRIRKIAADAFGDHHPHTLDLSRNELAYLDELVFAPLLANNTIVNVDENPFTCTGCQQYEWLLLFNKNHLGNLENFACADGTKLEDLTADMIECPAS